MVHVGTGLGQVQLAAPVAAVRYGSPTLLLKSRCMCLRQLVYYHETDVVACQGILNTDIPQAYNQVLHFGAELLVRHKCAVILHCQLRKKAAPALRIQARYLSVLCLVAERR